MFQKAVDFFEVGDNFNAEIAVDIALELITSSPLSSSNRIIDNKNLAKLYEMKSNLMCTKDSL